LSFAIVQKLPGNSLFNGCSIAGPVHAGNSFSVNGRMGERGMGDAARVLDADLIAMA
jgi:hypothetical protein